MLKLVVPNATLANPGRIVESALNTWTRLEPLPMSSDITPALQACVADPLWMLCRQWQFLEFAGEDAGTPIQVQVDGEIAPITRYQPGRPGAAGPSTSRAYSPDAMPLEALVEGESVLARHPRLVTEAGLHFVRMLTAAGIVSLRAAFLTAYPLSIAQATDAGADTMGDEWQHLARGRAIDARALAAVLLPLRGAGGALTTLPAVPVIPVNARSKALDVLGRWLTWYLESVAEPAGPEAWIPNRLEYAFSTAASVDGRETVLAAEEYADGELDWYSVRAFGGALGTTVTTAAITRVPVTLPSQVDYAGKPADRFWEFEDAKVHFGVVDAGPTDLARLLLIEFSLIYGNDWFVVPLRMPVGSIFQTKTFTVRDTFGVDTVIGPSENSNAFGSKRWSLFRVQRFNAPRNILYLAPTVSETLEGPPIEEVALFRDEMANMVWGVERRVQGVSGDGYDRTADEYTRAARQQVSGPPVDAQLMYRLSGSVPDNWIPFVPVPSQGLVGADPAVQLQRRALVRTEIDGQRRTIQPRGLLLRSDLGLPPETEPALRIEEEEVPREGAVVTRSFQFARWFDGRSILWLGRRKRPGRGEGASGLRFDAIERS